MCVYSSYKISMVHARRMVILYIFIWQDNSFIWYHFGIDAAASIVIEKNALYFFFPARAVELFFCE